MNLRHVLGRAFRALDRVPRWARLLLAAGVVALGVLTVLRPTSSLGALALLLGAGLVLQGVVEVVGATPGARGRATAAAAGWVLAGGLVLLLPGLTVRVLAVVVAVALLVHGALLLVSALRRGRAGADRLADAAFGVAGVLLGLLALAWPDITSLATAVAVGARLVMSGVALAWTTAGTRRSPRHRPRRRAVAALTAVAVAAGAAVLSGTLREGSTVTDDFYAAPRDVPAEPGRLVRAEDLTRGVPEGGRGWRVLYTTTRGDGTPAVASGLVVVPEGEGPWPVVDWHHGTTGVAEHCAPSLSREPFASGALLVLPEVLDSGWALVATDYIGLGTGGPHPYLVGPDSAHAALDAVRAARELVDLDDRTVAWGHSQGGGAALWSGALQPEYAPDVELAGVAALAPASDLRGLVAGLEDVTGGSVLASYVAAAYAAEYDDVTWRQYVRPGAEVVLRQMAERCLEPPGVLASVLTALALSAEPTLFAADPASGAFGARLTQNEPPPSALPVLLAQGGADTLITPAVQDAYVERLCARGATVDHRTYTGRDHLSLVAADSPLVPDLLAWTAERLRAAPVSRDCRTVRDAGPEAPPPPP
ncbi:Uncharacterized membrane protein HdeD, DUF308 family [Georgenia satyanarayanai]|uniref:Uncharacterized membrane protein HdeD, DUF308 family n=1 Tax=Georgenia satyanarayanai TaxID=860221 RepID=A0A2Y9AFM1_9MICO|nr:lipase family protein [Georgenia satyanarayanai]PYF99146.1 uncharacterized membrane protein HdeD (DUF308 family) [Georgenia satyanarayanai]SSA43264.1 Uncharacterized membrane protein HdeD, DUF308 family [Georgenia satyanarayanai]